MKLRAALSSGWPGLRNTSLTIGGTLAGVGPGACALCNIPCWPLRQSSHCSLEMVCSPQAHCRCSTPEFAGVSMLFALFRVCICDCACIIPNPKRRRLAARLLLALLAFTTPGRVLVAAALPLQNLLLGFTFLLQGCFGRLLNGVQDLRVLNSRSLCCCPCSLGGSLNHAVIYPSLHSFSQIFVHA